MASKIRIEAADAVTPPKRRRARGDTVERYMDAAEALFIRFGYEGTSIRAISARSKLNLGTVVYHWGTKEALFRAVCERRFGAIGAEQMSRLRECEAAFKTLGPDNIEPILRAFIEPTMHVRRGVKAAQITRLLYGRALTDPSPVVLRITADLFAGQSNLIRRLLKECLPELDTDTFFWRWTCALGAFVFAQSFGYRVAYAANLDDRNADWDHVTEEIVAFMVAGLRRG